MSTGIIPLNFLGRESAAMDQPINHNEAWSLACHKREESNLARCYIELREKAKAVVDTYYIASGKVKLMDGSDGYDQIRALRIIAEAND